MRGGGPTPSRRAGQAPRSGDVDPVANNVRQGRIHAVHVSV